MFLSVAIEAMLRPVVNEMTWATRMIPMVANSPA